MKEVGGFVRSASAQRRCLSKRNSALLSSVQGCQFLNTFTTASSAPSEQSKTIGGLLRETIQRYEHKDALVIKHANIRYTWVDLGKSVWPYADGFAAGRCLRGDRILATLDADGEQIILPLAASVADAVYSPARPTATKADLENYLRTLKAKFLVFPHKYRGIDKAKLIHELVPELSVLPYDPSASVLHSKKFPSLRGIFQVGGSPQPGLFSLKDVRWVDASPSPLPAADLISPNRSALVYWHEDKPITFTDASLLEAARGLAKRTSLSRDDRVCVAAPLYDSSFGFAAGVLASIQEAAVIVIPGAFFLPDQTLKCLARDSVTRLVCSSQQLDELLRDSSLVHTDLSRLQTVVIGVQADQVSSQALTQLLDRTKTAMKVKNIIVACTHPLVAGTFAVSTDGEILELLPGVEARVTAPAVGAKGDLFLKGSTATSGYWNAAKNSPNAISEDGWLKTGVQATSKATNLLLLN